VSQLCQPCIDTRRQDDGLSCMDAEPSHVWDSLQRIRQTCEARVTQREWIATAEDHFFDGSVARNLIECLAPTGRSRSSAARTGTRDGNSNGNGPRRLKS